MNSTFESILIADDNAFIRKLMRGILAGKGYRLFEAVDGEETVNVCFDQIPDLVLLDVEMPQRNGYEACAILKNDDRTKDIPVVFLSGRTGASDKIRGLELGASDYITKPFDKGEVLARVRTQLEIRRLTQSLMQANHQLRERQKTLDTDLRAAAQIQQSLIPKRPPETTDFEFAWRFIPCDRIGGDIFNIHRLDESNLAIYVLDVSGHGVPSAMVTVSVSQMLLPNTGLLVNPGENRQCAAQIMPPGEVLGMLDREYPIERFDKFFTIAYLVLNTRTGHVRYSIAGHPLPALVRWDGQLELLGSGGTVIGMGGLLSFEEGEATMQWGDRLYLYTDGLVEYANEEGDLYGEEKLFEKLVETRNENLNHACNLVVDSVTDHAGGARMQDDVTLLALECVKDE